MINNLNDETFIKKLASEIVHNINFSRSWTGIFHHTYIKDYKIIISYPNKKFHIQVLPMKNWFTPVINHYYDSLVECINLIITLCGNGIEGEKNVNVKSILDSI